ncbi:MAG: GNAT family N-acetyltransferase [Pseudomonadota bacterium]|jgi:GNAT superfamily N-acetyltransferase
MIRLRPATRADLPTLALIANTAIDELLSQALGPQELAASRMIMGVDTRLVDDGTYLVAEIDGEIAGCGGWSRRATLYGGDHSPGRDAALLNPAHDPARVRAMYTHPDFARRGVGRAILAEAERQARAEGFQATELAATLSGAPLYEACGYQAIEHFTDASGGHPVPLIRMRKSL